MFDHSHADPAHPHRATANPWASQRHSYADRLYNGQYNMSGPAYSPCFKFFTPAEAVAKSRGLARLIADTGAAASPTSNGEYQFKRPVGAGELVEDPCALFQEAYPPLCASDSALLRTPLGAEEHFAQYLIRDESPLKGCFQHASA